MKTLLLLKWRPGNERKRAEHVHVPQLRTTFLRVKRPFPTPVHVCPRNPKSPDVVKEREKERKNRSSQENLSGILRVALIRAVRTLESVALAEPTQRFLGYDVPTWHHHRRVLVGCLLLGNGADEDRMEEVGGWQRDLDLRVG